MFASFKLYNINGILISIDDDNNSNAMIKNGIIILDKSILFFSPYLVFLFFIKTKMNVFIISLFFKMIF